MSNKTLTCQDTLCLFCTSNTCLLPEVEIDRYGTCQKCYHVDMNQEELDHLKKRTTSKLLLELENITKH